MRLINKIIMLGLMAISILAFNSRAYSAAGDYGISCTNDAYGVNLGSVYYQATADTTQTITAYGVYAGTDCAYAGAGKTNSAAIVGGDIARSAANAIIGAVSGRLSAALSMNNDTAAHTSFTTNGNGVGMAANHIVGGLSVWTNFSSSGFENDQNFTEVGNDSNSYDGNSSALSVGLDKRFGNVVIGVAMTGYDSDIDIDVNKGNIQTEGETFGVYVGLNTGALNMSIGAGTGEYEVDTERTDLGSNQKITATDVTADVQYYHVNVSGTLSRGKLSFTPRIGYRNFDLDLPAYTEIVPNDTNTMIDRANGASSTIDGDAADVAVGGKTYSSDMTEAGLTVALSTGGKLTPYFDVGYVKEDTTSGAYETEVTADATSADIAASTPDGYVTYGGGLLLNLSNRVNGYLSITEVTARDDYNETTVSGSLKLKF